MKIMTRNKTTIVGGRHRKLANSAEAFTSLLHNKNIHCVTFTEATEGCNP